MQINPDIVPTTVRQAAELIANGTSQNEREYFRQESLATIVESFSMPLRVGWSLWEATPLKHDAVKNYKIAHADDISNLILAWARAMILGEPFDAVEYCRTFHDHWITFGLDSLRAGNWPLVNGRRIIARS